MTSPNPREGSLDRSEDSSLRELSSPVSSPHSSSIDRLLLTSPEGRTSTPIKRGCPATGKEDRDTPAKRLHFDTEGEDEDSDGGFLEYSTNLL